MKYLFVGLGNPGQDYHGTRHNIGFEVIDFFASYYQFPEFQIKGQGLFSSFTIDCHTTILYKPTTFMNLSGKALIALVQFFKLPLDHIFVFHDDLNISPGDIRMKQGGGHGGHNGLKSIDQAIGKAYWRVRIGIGHPGDRDLVSSYVLGRFRPPEREKIHSLFSPMALHIPQVFTRTPTKYINDVKHDLNGVH